MKPTTHRGRMRLRGFTLLELQVAIVLLSFGVVTLASLMATQSRLTRRLNAGFSSGSTVHATRLLDPRVRKLSTTARLTPAEIAHTAPAAVDPRPTRVSIVTSEAELKARRRVPSTADATPIPQDCAHGDNRRQQDRPTPAAGDADSAASRNVVMAVPN